MLSQRVLTMNERNQELSECAILTENEKKQLEADLAAAVAKQQELQEKLDSRAGSVREEAAVRSAAVAQETRKEQLEALGFKDGVAPESLEEAMKQKLADAKSVNSILQ